MLISHETLRNFCNQESISKQRCASSENINQIAFISEPITYDYFVRTYLIPNIPCIFGKWITDGWLSRSAWVEAGHICEESLKKCFGNAEVPVVDCSNINDYGQEKKEMKFEEFLEYFNKDTNSELGCANPLLYLKDWHFVRDFPDYEAYTTPIYFTSDWLNEFWDSRKDCSDDYRFLYMGSAGTWTPFHADVLHSYSWSANICGTKKWIIYRAGDESKLSSGESIPSDVSNVEIFSSSSTLSSSVQCKRFEVIQQAGEIIFIPSGWHHQVFNLENTLSINHNWFNAFNVDISWNYIKSSLYDVQQEIKELKSSMDDWLLHCQRMLRANIGFDYFDFYNLIYCIAERRLNFLQSSADSFSFHGNNETPPAVERSNVTDTVSIIECPSVGRTESACFSKSSTGSTYTDTDSSPTCSGKNLPANTSTRTSLNGTTASTYKNYYTRNDINHAIYDLQRICNTLKDMCETNSFIDLWTADHSVELLPISLDMFLLRIETVLNKNR